jgi:hypothetical protein
MTALLVAAEKRDPAKRLSLRRVRRMTDSLCVKPFSGFWLVALRMNHTGARREIWALFAKRREARLTASMHLHHAHHVTQLLGFVGGHQRAGVLVQMSLHPSKVLNDLGIGFHTRPDNIYRQYMLLGYHLR